MSVGKAKVKKELFSLVGQYPELSRRTAKLIANSSLIELLDVGHIPHLEAPELFHKELLKFLKAN
jgi:pimeloyl-ACP methyl ester carboxylesterase